MAVVKHAPCSVEVIRRRGAEESMVGVTEAEELLPANGTGSNVAVA